MIFNASLRIVEQINSNMQLCMRLTNKAYTCYTCRLKKKIQMCKTYHVLNNKRLHYKVYNLLKTNCTYLSDNEIQHIVFTILSNIELVLRLVYEQVYVKKICF